MIDVIPGIGPQTDFDIIKRRIELVEDLVDWVHIDILDNTLIHNVTYNNWEAFSLYTDRLNLEAHLMVGDPAKYVKPLFNFGFKRLIGHVESDTVREFLETARTCEIEVGLALDGPSRLELIEPYLESIDVALIMTITAGFSGQIFQREQLPKIKKIHVEYGDLAIEVDGGINKETGALAVADGANRLAVTSYLFNKPETIEAVIEELKSLG